ncbi:MAG: SDR family oxidoreductase [Spirochaetaceae bacterium]|nr:SDR family oxidoreductase [Spirochaetaceae bacterium]
MKDEPVDLHGKIAVVTGSTNGIGYETAKALAAMGASVVVVGRQLQKTEAARNEIAASTGNQSTDFIAADLSTLAAMRRFAADFKSRYEKLDILVNNVGAIYPKRQETVDGFEATFALNYLSYFCLSRLLIGSMEKAGSARIVNVSSVAHVFFGIKLDDLQAKKFYWPYCAYGRSKLEVLLFTYRFAEQLKNRGITVNALHPGLVRTSLDMSYSFMKYSRPVFSAFGKSAEEGAATSIYLASSGEVENVTGLYFVDKKPARSSRLSRRRDLQERLWKMSIAMAGQAE